MPAWSTVNRRGRPWPEWYRRLQAAADKVLIRRLSAGVSLQDGMSRVDIGAHFGRLQLAFSILCVHYWPGCIISTIPRPDVFIVCAAA